MSELRLQDKVLKAKQAIQAAGFASGNFKPDGTALRVDVIVPVTFYDFDKTEEELVLSIRTQIACLVATTHTQEPESLPPSEAKIFDTSGCPYDLRTAKGKAWKQGRLAGLVEMPIPTLPALPEVSF